MKRVTALVAIAAAIATPATGHAAAPADVDPLIGTAGAGNTFPGAAVPFGFAVASPDTKGHAAPGYKHGEPIVGFSQSHASGTGGAGKYGNFRLLAELGEPTLTPRAVAKGGESASPGYYAVELDSGVRAELTAARLATATRFTFPPRADAHVVLNAGSFIPATGALGQRLVANRVKVTGARTFEGEATVTGGWGDTEYTLHFAAALDRTPATLRTISGHKPAGKKASGAKPVGVAASLDARQDRDVNVTIGLSFRDTASARRNLGQVAGGFDATRARAADAWRAALARIDVQGGSATERRVFATALYHAQLMPHDLTGDNAWWHSSEPHYEDVFTLWDTFRTQNPLLTLIQPRRERDIVRSLIDTYRHTGWLPDARVAGGNGLTQVGSNGDVVVADALVKGLEGIDYQTGYRALRKDADVDSRHWVREGRQLTDYLRLGYVPTKLRASASRTLEYAYDDFAVSEVASVLGHAKQARAYRKRARNWRRLWDPETRSIRPRSADGRFASDFDPLRAQYGWRDPFYEGSPLQYSTFVPQDVQGLIDRLGGDGPAIAWLDDLMKRGYSHSNEPDLLAPFLYVHAGRPDRTADSVRRIAGTQYGAGRHGLPGNDDSGTLSAWYVWAGIGLYPNAGQAYYYIGSPLFERSTIRLGGGRRFTVSAPGASDSNRYVVGARLDGRPLARAFLKHSELARGGTLELDMATAPNGFGSAKRPPSPAH